MDRFYILEVLIWPVQVGWRSVTRRPALQTVGAGKKPDLQGTRGETKRLSWRWWDRSQCRFVPNRNLICQEIEVIFFFLGILKLFIEVLFQISLLRRISVYIAFAPLSPPPPPGKGVRVILGDSDQSIPLPDDLRRRHKRVRDGCPRNHQGSGNGKRVFHLWWGRQSGSSGQTGHRV